MNDKIIIDWKTLKPYFQHFGIELTEDQLKLHMQYLCYDEEFMLMIDEYIFEKVKRLVEKLKKDKA